MITLQHLEANNFKSLRSVALTFPKRGNILIEGYNEAGKSTLFEAVYVALYGKPLVGEDPVAKRDEVIQHGQSQATLRLVVNIGQSELTIERIFERGKSQQATLTIQRPGLQPEVVNRVRAVEDRILKELGNLDGDSLRNSCFVEQKELGRIEALSLAQREQAIQKLLGLERLTQLIEQFKFRREQERELNQAHRYLKLAQLQSDGRAVATEEAALAERLDAIKVIIQVEHLVDLQSQIDEVERSLHECIARAQETRDRLKLCATVKEHSGRCNQVANQVIQLSHARNEVNRVTQGLARLNSIEKIELPQAIAYQREISMAAEAVARAVHARKQVQEADEVVREARRSLKELEQAEAEQRRKEEELTQAQLRVTQRRREAESERQRLAQQMNELEARRVRLERALALVEQWEDARGQLQIIQQNIAGIESRQQELTQLQVEKRRREDEKHNLASAVAHAENEMRQAAESLRLATVHEALTTWVRLKSVELALSGNITQHTTLLDRSHEAEKALVTAQSKTHPPLFVALALTITAIAALMVGVLWLPAIAFFAVALLGSVASWLWFFKSRKNTKYYSDALAQSRLELQRLDMQRQAAIQAGGDPAMLGQCEQQLQAAGFAKPSNIEDGRALLEALQKRLGSPQERHVLQEIAQTTRDTHIRLNEQFKQSQYASEASKRALELAQQSGNPIEQLNQLKPQLAQQGRIVATREAIARQSVEEDGLWPTSSSDLKMLLSTCQGERQVAEEACKRHELTAHRMNQEAEADRERAEAGVKRTREVVVAQKATDPASQLSRAQEQLANVDAIYRQQEAFSRLLLSKVQLQTEADVEPERGRAEARVQALQKELRTRPMLQEEYETKKAAFIDLLNAITSTLKALLADLNRLSISELPTFPQMPDEVDASFPYEQVMTITLTDIRNVLQAALTALNEQDARSILDEALSEQGRINQQRDIVENDMKKSRSAINTILLPRHIDYPSTYSFEGVFSCWSLTSQVSINEESQVAMDLDEARKRLYSVRQQESQLAAELQYPGSPLSIEECQQKVNTLAEEREICILATKLLKEAHDRIARRVLPITERNMQPLLQQLTGGRYRDVRLTPEDTNGQPGEMDYRIRVWDPNAGRYVAKNLFSGGTRDQCSLALRLAFALATLPQELGVAPGFIFLDEPLSAFDAQRAKALVELITTGTIAQQFNQVVLISHQHAFDKQAFQYHVRMESGQIAESDLPSSEDDAVEVAKPQSFSVVGD